MADLVLLSKGNFMNKTEYYNCHNRCDNEYKKYYKYVQKLLRDWKVENNITGRCVVHHIDNEPVAIKYNNSHYEMFGCEIDENGDLKFELGKYVQFMTQSEHSRYHNSGDNCTKETRAKISAIHKGKIVSLETRAKMSAAHKGVYHPDHNGEKNPFYGKTHSNEVKAKISAYQKGYSILWDVYKNNDGTKSYNEFKKALKSGDITFEMQPISVFIK